MAALTFAALCSGLGLGMLLIVQGIRGRRVLPDFSPLADRATAERAFTWLAAASIAALVILAITGWPVAAVAAFGSGRLRETAPRRQRRTGDQHLPDPSNCLVDRDDPRQHGRCRRTRTSPDGNR